MQNQSVADSIRRTGKLFEYGVELPVEQEILLADYDSPVFKIIKSNIECTVTQKYITGGKLNVEGFFRISVFYRPPQSKNITVVNKRVPFQKSFDIAEEVKAPYFITVFGDIRYVNTRAINPTRIDIRGAYGLTARVYGGVSRGIVTAVNSKNVCRDSREISRFVMSARGIRQFSTESEINSPGDFEKVLNISSNAGGMTVTVYNDKVNIKGEITADIAYTVKDSREIQIQSKSFVYNQIVDVPGAKEKDIAFADLDIVNVAITQNSETEKVSCIITAALDVKCFVKSRVIAVTDAFSKKYRDIKRTKDILRDGNITAVNRTIQVFVSDTVPYPCKVLYSFGSVGNPQVIQEGDKCLLKSKVTVNVFRTNGENDMECYTKTEDCTLDIGEKINRNNEYILTCRVASVSATGASDSIKAGVNISINGFVIKREKYTVMEKYSENTEKPLEETENALILYYGKKGEKVFDIARRYRADINFIVEENRLAEKVLTEDKMLFIPAFGM